MSKCAEHVEVALKFQAEHTWNWLSFKWWQMWKPKSENWWNQRPFWNSWRCFECLRRWTTSLNESMKKWKRTKEKLWREFEHFQPSPAPLKASPAQVWIISPETLRVERTLTATRGRTEKTEMLSFSPPFGVKPVRLSLFQCCKTQSAVRRLMFVWDLNGFMQSDGAFRCFAATCRWWSLICVGMFDLNSEARVCQDSSAGGISCPNKEKRSGTSTNSQSNLHRHLSALTHSLPRGLRRRGRTRGNTAT